MHHPAITYARARRRFRRRDGHTIGRPRQRRDEDAARGILCSRIPRPVRRRQHHNRDLVRATATRASAPELYAVARARVSVRGAPSVARVRSSLPPPNARAGGGEDAAAASPRRAIDVSGLRADTRRRPACQFCVCRLFVRARPVRVSSFVRIPRYETQTHNVHGPCHRHPQAPFVDIRHTLRLRDLSE